jgi:gluconate kinase|tara:strand:+ start:1552 stop:1707 length:156 start_codon:yes stop_codon:yes gene_type:complete
MGVSSFDKMLAEKYAIQFINADDYHSQNNINKMKKYIPFDAENCQDTSGIL